MQNCTLYNCENNGNISVDSDGSFIGGMCGNASYGEISECNNYCKEIGGGSYVAGICGNSIYTKISSCTNTSSINASNSDIGGIVGYIQHYTYDIAIDSCTNSGSINGSTHVGGIAGGAESSTLRYCSNTGDVEGSSYVGKIIGYNTNSKIIYYVDTSTTINTDYSLDTDSITSLEDYVTYGISSETGLSNLKDLVNNGNTSSEAIVYLLKNITITSAMSIGTSSNQFNCHFISLNHSITISTSSSSSPLFNYVGHSGVIQNLTVKSSLSYGFVSGLCNNLTGGYIGNCANYINVSSSSNVGGICNKSDSGIIYKCTNYAKISGNQYCGGICGYSTGYIYGCSNESGSKITASSSCVGGICGYVKDYIVEDCENDGEIVGNGEYTGGIVGILYSNAYIYGCKNKSSVSSDSNYTGGIVGYAYSGNEIAYCTNTGDAVVKGSDYVGGIGGYLDCSVICCYNKGYVYSSSGSNYGDIYGSSGSSYSYEECSS